MAWLQLRAEAFCSTASTRAETNATFICSSSALNTRNECIDLLKHRRNRHPRLMFVDLVRLNECWSNLTKSRALKATAPRASYLEPASTRKESKMISTRLTGRVRSLMEGL